MAGHTVRDIMFATFRSLHLRSLLLIFLIAVPGADGQPAVDDHLKLITLHKGTNAVNLDATSLMATVIIARRDNFNAHSFEVTTIYATLKASGDEEPELKIIPIRREGQEDVLHLTTSGGADCVLQDFRLFADPGKHSAVLITATRKFGASFADEQLVTFEYFRLTRNAEGLPGSPALYFNFEKRWDSKKPFCDVNDAFRDELNIPSGRQPAHR